MSKPTVFISAVSSEFAEERRTIARRLRWDGWTPIYHDELRHGRESLLSDLEAEIARCSAAAYLIGRRSGGGFPALGETERERGRLPDGMNRASYTQWELLLADKHDTRRLIFDASEAYLAATPRAEPHDDDAPDLQATFATWLRNRGVYRASFDSLDSVTRDLRRELGQAPKPPNQKTVGLFRTIGDRFVGRDSLIDDLQEDLRRGNRAVISASIRGMSGVGKTRAAIEYAWARRWDYPTAMVLIQAGSADRMWSNFADLIESLDVPGKAAIPPDQRAEAVIRWFGQHQDWLLILDNVDGEDAMDAAHRLAGRLGGGDILITSRLGFVPQGFSSLRLDVLSPDAAVAFLLQAAPTRMRAPDDDEQARLLGQELGYLALALTHAAAYIRRYSQSFAAYRAELAQAFQRVLGAESKDVTDHHEKSTLATLEVSLGRATAGGRALLERLAFLADEPVPRFLLEVPDSDGVNQLEAEADLADYSLVTRDDQAASFTTHRLVRAVVRRSLSESDARTRLEQALRWVNAAFVGDPDEVENWPRLSRLLSHADTLATQSATARVLEPTDRLMHQVAQYALIQNDLVRADRVAGAALKIARATKGNNHSNTIECLLLVSAVHFAAGNLRAAAVLARESCVIADKIFGDSHGGSGRFLNMLARILHAMGEFSQAKQAYQKALQIARVNLGDQHRETLTYYNNIGLLMKDIGLYGPAEKIFRTVVTDSEIRNGPVHRLVGIGLNNLADSIVDPNRLDEVEALHRRALSITESSDGKYHIDVAIRRNGLAEVLRKRGKTQEACQSFARAFWIIRKNYDKDHVMYANIYNNAGLLRLESNQAVKAARLLRRALKIAQKHHDSGHVMIGIFLANLGLALFARNCVQESTQSLKESILILLQFRRTTGRTHPYFGTVLSNYKVALQKLGRTEAEIAVELQSMLREVGPG